MQPQTVNLVHMSWKTCCSSVTFERSTTFKYHNIFLAAQSPTPTPSPSPSSSPSPSPSPSSSPAQPSECSSYKSIDEADRSINYKGAVKCDSGLTPAWYRFEGAAGDRLPEVAPDKNYCGTHAPGWLNGKHPTPPEGRVQRQVCFHWSNNNCLWKQDIEVRNCGAYFVYKLDKPKAGCSLRFCVTKGNHVLLNKSMQSGLK